MLYPVVLAQLPQETDAKKDQAFETLESLLEENGKGSNERLWEQEQTLPGRNVFDPGRKRKRVE